MNTSPGGIDRTSVRESPGKPGDRFSGSWCWCRLRPRRLIEGMRPRCAADPAEGRITCEPVVKKSGAPGRWHKRRPSPRPPQLGALRQQDRAAAPSKKKNEKESDLFIPRAAQAHPGWSQKGGIRNAFRDTARLHSPRPRRTRPSFLWRDRLRQDRGFWPPNSRPDVGPRAGASRLDPGSHS